MMVNVDAGDCGLGQQGVLLSAMGRKLRCSHGGYFARIKIMALYKVSGNRGGTKS